MQNSLLTLFTLCLFGLSSSIYGQGQFNSFEENFGLDIFIDTSMQSNNWQIGKPQKTNFSASFSLPNALLTDTVSSYSPNTLSSFYIHVDMRTIWAGYPLFVLQWQHKMDCEIGKDGGIIEVSYDSMQTWSNIFTDTSYQPVILGDLLINLLPDGTPTLSEISDWKRIGFCWTTYDLDPIEDVFIRFSFLADSVDTEQAGWMIDDLEAYAAIVDNVEELNQQVQAQIELACYPNPASSELTIRCTGISATPLKLHLRDANGRLRNQWSSVVDKQVFNISHLQAGSYTLSLVNSSNQIVAKQQFIKVSK